MMLSECLFNPVLLEELNFDDTAAFKKHGLSAKNAGPNLIMRPLCLSDYHKDYLKLMSQLTDAGEVSPEQFQKRFEEMRACKNTYFIIVIENVAQSKIAASGSVVLEKHLDRSARVVTRGRIEDIVVLESHRGMQLGKLLLEALVLMAQRTGCDELSLECKDHLIKFYNQFGFVHQKEDRYMAIRFPSKDH